MLVLNGLGSAKGSPPQTDYTAQGLVPATVYYAGDVWTSTPFAGNNTTILPSDAEIEAAAALCTNGYALLDIECWDKNDETGNARAVTLHQKFRQYLPPTVLLGSYDWGGLWGYAATIRCTKPYGVGTSVYENFFQAGNDASLSVAEHVDFLAPSFYLTKHSHLIAQPNDFKVTAECYAAERARLGLEDKPIIPWVWWNYFGPTAGQVLITGITQANPGVVTCSGSSLNDFPSGTEVFIWLVNGMTQVNKRRFNVQRLTSNTWELRDPDTLAPVDTTGYGGFAASPDSGMNRVSPLNEWAALLNACETYLDGCILWLYSQQAPPNYDPTLMPHFAMLAEYASRGEGSVARAAAAQRGNAADRPPR